MQWPKWWSTPSTSTSESPLEKISREAEQLQAKAQQVTHDLHNEASKTVDLLQTSSGNRGLVTALTQPTNIAATAILTTAILALFAAQRRFLRRFPTASEIPSTYILSRTKRLSRSLFGRVTTVGDADNFRLFHTPLGRLGLWGVLRRVPHDAKALKNNTVHVRLAGIDAPELSHFGRPAQPYSKEALDWLTGYVKGRRVRCYIHKADQYGRVVGTVYIRKGMLRRDVGLQMLRMGLATVYEAKTGAEFAGRDVEQKYREAEAWAKGKKRGMWADRAGNLESPREYKNRYREGG